MVSRLKQRIRANKRKAVILLTVLGLFSASYAQAITVTVVGWNRTTKTEVPVNGFR